MALFGPEHTRWDGLINFWHEIYLPYFIGALGPGIILSAIGYYITIPLVDGLSEGPRRQGQGAGGTPGQAAGHGAGCCRPGEVAARQRHGNRRRH
jgi:hypothetical protein